MKTAVRGATLASILLLVAAAALANGGDGIQSCSTSCWWGASCSASGPPPCSCSCTGFFGLGGPRCSCGGMEIQNPPGN